MKQTNYYYSIRDNQTVYTKQWVEADILFIRQLVNLNGQLMTYFLLYNADFGTKFKNTVGTILFMYSGTVNAIRQYQQKCNLELRN